MYQTMYSCEEVAKLSVNLNKSVCSADGALMLGVADPVYHVIFTAVYPANGFSMTFKCC